VYKQQKNQTVHGHLVDLRAVVLLDIAQYANVVVHDEVDCDILASETARTTKTVTETTE
jgi:hypothetical protein